MTARPLGDDVDLERVGRYRSLPEMEAAFASVRGIREVVDGTSHEGRAIRRFELGDADAAQVSLVLGGLHAMEWIGVETALAVAEDFSRRSPGGERLVLLPLLNPDGYAKAERELRAGKRRFTRRNARGVDLNRNFPTHWSRWHPRARLLPFLGGPGPTPASEIETKVVLSTLARERGRERGRTKRAVSLHSFGKKILLPFGGRWQPPPNLGHLRGLANEVNAGLDHGYEVRLTSRWLPGAFAYGLELDHLHAEGIDAILVECSAGGFSWRDPSSWLHPFRWFNPPDPAREAASIAGALRTFLFPHTIAAHTTTRASNEVHA